MSEQPLFQRVHAHEIPAWWEFVGEGLREIIRRCPTVPWTPRDVRRILRAEQAFLYVREDGFVVIQPLTDYITGEPYLNVWHLWFEAGRAAALRDELLEWLDTVCLDLRCEWWEFTSTREEWDDALRGACGTPRLTWVRVPT